MPLSVAQLNIGVQVDTGPALAGLEAIEAAYRAAAEAASSSSAQEAGSIAALVGAEQQTQSAISSVTMAIRQQTAVIQEGGNVARNAVNSTTIGMGSMASAGGRAFQTLGFGLMTAGQDFGPVQRGIQALSFGLLAIPRQASAASTALMGVAIAATAIGAVSIAAAVPQEQAQARLKTAIDNTGHSWDEYSKDIQKAIDKGTHWGWNAGETQDALARMTVALKSPTLALKEQTVAADLAAGAYDNKLRPAVDTIDRAVQGYGRGLKTIGINLDLWQVKQSQITAATKKEEAATNALTKAKTALSAAEQRHSDDMAVAALQADKLAQAETTLQTAEENLANTMQNVADANTRAQQSIQDAVQAYQDVQDRINAENSVPQVDEVSRAVDRLTEAKDRLAQAQQGTSTTTQAAAVDLQRLAEASDRVLDAQMKMAGAQGSNILSAQNQLRAAVDAQRKALDEEAAKHSTTLSQQNSLVSAQIAVKQATEDLTIAQAKQAMQAAGTTPQQISQAIELRNAKEAIAKAQTAADETARKGADEVRRANEEVAKAQQGVAQAINDQAIAAIRAEQGELAVEKAQDRVTAATEKQKQAAADLAALKEKQKDAELHNIKLINDAIESRMKHSADNQAKTTGGMLRRIKAEIQNFVADIGSGPLGKGLAIGGSLVQAALMFKLLRGGGAAASGAEALGAGGAADGMGGVGAAAAGPGLASLLAMGGASWLGGSFLSKLTGGQGPGVASGIGGGIGALGFLLGPEVGIPTTALGSFIGGHAEGWFNDIFGGGGSDKKKSNSQKGADQFASVKVEMDSIIQKVKEAKMAIDMLKPVDKQFADMAKRIGEVASMLDKQFHKAAVEAAKDIKNVGKSIDDVGGDLKHLHTELGSAKDWLKDRGKEMIEGFTNGAKSRVDDVENWLRTTFHNKVGNAIEHPKNWLKHVGEEMTVGFFEAAMDEIPGHPAKFANEVRNRLVAHMDDHFTHAAGQNVVFGLTWGIHDEWEKSGKAFVIQFADNVKRTFANELGIKSPSTVFREHGHDIMRGLVQGLTVGESEVRGKMRNIARELGEAGAAVPAGLTGLGSTGGTIIINHTPVKVDVQGNAIYQRDLERSLQDALTRAGRDQGGNVLGGWDS